MSLVSDVAGVGLSVGTGERAIKILGYSTNKVAGTYPDTGEEVEDRLGRYPVLSAFDIAQTDGEPETLPETA
jgi:hypothetical protein